LVYTGGGPGTIESQVAALDFGELRMRSQEKAKKELEEAQLKAKAALVDSGTVSALDLNAPPKAVKEYNQGVTLLRSQHSPEAIPHLQKSLELYPKFVSALNALGMAYNDTDDNANAKIQFEKAVSLDDKFARPIMNLGRLSIAQNDYEAAETYFQKAALLRPTDIDVLTALAIKGWGTLITSPLPPRCP
jgi:Flp pilus assembly protein TadD